MPTGKPDSQTMASRAARMRARTAMPRAAKVQRVQNGAFSIGRGCGPRRTLYASAASGTVSGQNRVTVTVMTSTQRTKAKITIARPPTQGRVDEERGRDGPEGEGFGRFPTPV